VLTAPFEVHLSEESRPVQPDVMFILEFCRNWELSQTHFFPEKFRKEEQAWKN